MRFAGVNRRITAHHPLRALVVFAALLLAALGLDTVAPAGASTGPGFADAETATVHPGVMMFTDGAQCTANFVFTDGTDVFIGYAAHCAGLGGSSDTNGCDTPSMPLGTPVEIDGASRAGTLAYSSWQTMQDVLADGGSVSANACAYNDFALVQIHPDDVSSVNPSIPHWGGPQGINPSDVPSGSSVYSYGNSSLRLGVTTLSPKEGTSLGTRGGGWTHPVYMSNPGVPGDSGSAMLDSQGRAAGVLSTLAIAPLTGSNNYSDLASTLGFMQTHAADMVGVNLVEGDVAFDGAQVSLGV